MIHQQLLRRAVAGRSPALVDFVESIAPRLLERFTTIPALGGSGQPQSPTALQLPEGVIRFTEEELVLFGEKNPDQSLTAHILNGLFAGLRLAERLPPEKALSDTEQRLWVLGYIVHDYTKVYGIKVPAGQLDTIRQVVRHLGEELSFDTYLPDWLDYLDDIVFLAQNTQKVEGANLNLRDYRLKARIRRLDVLRLLSSYADVLVHIKSPSEVMLPAADGRNRAENLRETLADLFGADRAPRLAYHKLAEVRGLLSNLINNAVMTELKQQGYEPYLFFPNGVVYLADPGIEANVEARTVADRVWGRVLEIVSESESFGIKPWTTGLLVSSGLYEMAGLAGVLNAGLRRVMRLTTNNSPARLYGFFTGQSENDLKKALDGDMEQVKAEQEKLIRAEGIPADERVHKLGEFLGMVYRTVRDQFKKAPDIQPVLLDILGLEWQVEEIQPEGGKRRGGAKRVRLIEGDQTREGFWEKGGVYFGWFYAAARYVQAHPGLDDAGIEDTMRNISERVLTWVEEAGLEAKADKGLDEAIKEYAAAQVEVSGLKLDADRDMRAVFAQELNQYMTAKAEYKPVCSMCSAQYEATGQEATEVPFGPQSYTNKHPLGWSKVVRGICPVCRIELILRLIRQGVPSGKYLEEAKPVWFFLYPTYFFTPETASVVWYFVSQFQTLNVFGLRDWLRQSGFSLNAFLNYEEFLVAEEDLPRTLRISRSRPPKYTECDHAGFFFFPVEPIVKRRPGRGPKSTDTDSWAVPALLAVGIPLLLDVKAVVTPSFVPLFQSGADFREMTVLDGPHSFMGHVWERDRFRVDELEEALIKLLELYDLHLDVFAEGYDPHWPQINAVAKDVATDPFYIFSYYERKERTRGARQRKKGGQPTFKGISSQDLERYLEIYHMLGGEINMGIIGKLVDAYAAFYRARKLDSAYGILRPLGTAMDVIVKSDPHTERDDLLLLVTGAVHDDIDRVRADQAEGWIPLKTEEPEQKWFPLLRQKIEEFGQMCVDDLFYSYCQGDRAVLRERMNRLRSAARFYYLQNYGYQK